LHNVCKSHTIVCEMHTKQLKSLITRLFPRVRTGVLARLLLDMREWHARELARVLNLNHAAVARELRHLAEAGIIKRRRSGNRVYYSANEQCAIYPELRGLMLKTAGLADVLAKALAFLSPRIKVAYVYGSMADGSATADSDVDLMVVGKASLAQVIEVLGNAEQALGREINATVYSFAEYRSKLKQGRGFIYEVHTGSVIMVQGALHELE